MKAFIAALFGLFLLPPAGPDWGFFGHQKINRLAVFTLPPEMIRFYKHHINFIEEASVNPDRRRYSVEGEAPRHYIDLDHYGDSAAFTMPRRWEDAVEKFSEDTLQAYGIVPWHVHRMYRRLVDAMLTRDVHRILRVSSELGHYVGDAHVPLHTTENYNGQLTGQEGIHGFWESRLPELFFDEYDFFTGPAHYVDDVQNEVWNIVVQSHVALDSVLRIEKKLADVFQEKRFAYETRGRQTQKVFSTRYARAYHQRLSGMVERRMRSAILFLGCLWYSAWVDAGQPNLNELIDHPPTPEQIEQYRQEVEAWRTKRIASRPHEGQEQ